MNSSRRYNQILFITTLSVYLGLVLAGGVPPAFAQISAKTSEKNPDDALKRVSEECILIKPTVPAHKYNASEKRSYDLDDYIAALIDFTRHAGCVNAPDFEVRGQVFNTGLSKDLDDIFIRYEVEDPNSITSPVIADHIYAIANTFQRYQAPGVYHFVYDYAFNPVELYATVDFQQPSADEALRLKTFFEAEIIDKKSAKAGSKSGILYQNTTVFVERDELRIVTRLPRAGLGSLLTD